MNNKQVLIAVGIMIIVGGVIGIGFNDGKQIIPVDTTKSQEEFDKINFDESKLGYNYTKVICYPENDFCVFNFDYTTWKKNNANYSTIETKYRTRYYISTWNQCLDVNALTTCNNIVKENITNQVNNHYNIQIYDLKNWQTPNKTSTILGEQAFDFSHINK